MAFDRFIDPNLFSGEFFPQRSGVDQHPLFPQGYDISYLLPAVFLEQEVWRDFLVSTAEVFNSALAEPIKSLAYIRLPETQDRIYKALHAKMMAFYVQDDAMTNELYDATNDHLGHYQEGGQGRDNFVRFLGWSMDIDLRLTRLWTKDYKSFHASNGTQGTIFEGGDWYPTTHVGLGYDPGSRDGEISEEYLREAFYKHAPAELVLKWIARMQTILIGTLYIGITSFAEVFAKSHLNGLGDLDLNLNMYQFMMQEYKTSHMATNYNNIDVGVGLASFDTDIAYSNTVADFITRITDKIPTSRYHHRRPTIAWQWTGIGKGRWVGENAPRVSSVDPVTGSVKGAIEFEEDSLNYIRSATKFGRAPWQVQKDASVILLHSDNYRTNADSSDSRSWFTSSGSAWIYQDFVVTKDDYAFQILYRRAGDSITLKIETIDVDQNVITLVNPTSSGNASGDNWRLYTYNVNKADLPANIALLRVSVQITTTPLEVFYAGMELGTKISSFIYTNDCDVGHRSADSAYFDLTNSDSQLGISQGSFGISFVTGTLDYGRTWPFRLMTAKTFFGANEDLYDLERVSLEQTNNNFTLNLREVVGSSIRSTPLNRIGVSGTMKIAFSWQRKLNYPVTPSHYVTEIGMQSSTETTAITNYIFDAERLEIHPFRGFIGSMLWIPANLTVPSIFDMNW